MSEDLVLRISSIDKRLAQIAFNLSFNRKLSKEQQSKLRKIEEELKC